MRSSSCVQHYWKTLKTFFDTFKLPQTRYCVTHAWNSCGRIWSADPESPAESPDERDFQIVDSLWSTKSDRKDRDSVKIPPPPPNSLYCGTTWSTALVLLLSSSHQSPGRVCRGGDLRGRDRLPGESGWLSDAKSSQIMRRSTFQTIAFM